MGGLEVSKDVNYSLEEIGDRLAIQSVIARYVHALDSGDIELLDDVFLSDAEFDLTSAGGLRGSWPELKSYFSNEHRAKFARDFHLFSNVLVEFDEGRATAQTRSKVINPRVLPHADGSAALGEIAVGVYQDSWRRSPDGWRIARRVWTRAFVLQVSA